MNKNKLNDENEQAYKPLTKEQLQDILFDIPTDTSMINIDYSCNTFGTLLTMQLQKRD